MDQSKQSFRGHDTEIHSSFGEDPGMHSTLLVYSPVSGFLVCFVFKLWELPALNNTVSVVEL